MSGNKRKQYSILKKTAGFYFLKQFFFYFFIAVFLSSIIDGCSPVGRYKALSFFFDGVPNPDFVAGKDSTGGNLISGQPVAVKSTGPEFYFHPPYGRNECARCHDNEAIGMLKAAVPVLCYRCHSDFRNSYDFLHGPVGAGYCMMCHQHHSSEYEKLLVKSGQELCFTCHEPSDVMRNLNHKKIGTANCTDCHNPHGGNEKFNLRTLAAKGYKHPALAAQIAMESEINTLADSSVKLLETERESPSPDTTLKPSYGKTLALTFFFGQVHRNLPGDIHPAMELLLLDNNGIVLSTTTTDSSGNFSIGIPQTGGSCIFRLKDDTCDAIISITEKNPELKYVMIKDKTGKYEFNKLALQNTTLGFEQVTDSTGISFIEPGNTSPVIPRLSGQIFGNISEPVHPGTEIFALNESREIIGVTRIDGKGNFVFRKLPPYNNYLFILKDVKDVPVHNIGKIYVGNITDKEIVPIGKGKDGYFRYRYLPFQALALWVTDASMDTLGLTHLNKDGFYVFDLLPDDSNLTFILSGGKNTSAIDEMNVIVNGRMRKIKKGTDNLFRFVKLPQGITRLYFMNETGDTLQTAFMNNDGFFDFKNGLPYRDNYLFLLDADNAGIADEIQILYPDDKSRQRIITLVKTEGAFFRYRPLPGEESKLYRLDQNYDTLDIAFMNEEGYFVFHELPTVNNYFFLLETRDAGMFQTVPVQIISGNGAIKEIIAKKESGARYRYEFPEQANAVIADSLKEQFIAVNLDKVEKKIVDFAVRNVEFNLGQFVINLYSYKYIEQISRLLISNPQWHIQVSGHTDNIGNENFNLLLSEKRAETVKRALVKRGIQANRIITKYFGESKPVADNLTPHGRQKNRRVEMEILQSKEVAEIPVAVEDEVWKSSITGTGMHDIVFTVNIFTSVEKINLSPANFNGIENVEEIADSDAFRYIAGISYDYDYAAAVLLNEMNQAGFNDAVVIALSNGKIIPVLKAVIMTKDKFPER